MNTNDLYRYLYDISIGNTNYDFVTIADATDEVFDEQEEDVIPHYGVNVNASYVLNDDTCSLGIHITDSEGKDADVMVEGDNFYDVIYAGLVELREEIADWDKEPAEEDSKEKEIQQLKADLGNIQQRLDALLNS